MLALAILFGVLLATSWQRWTHPIIDHGREMNLPTRLLAGEQLYLNVQFLYGPLAPHFNALLFRLFGIHLMVLHVSGAVCAALVLMMIYWLARQWMDVKESALVTALVLVCCALKSTGNYLQPYTYAALYSLVFILGSLICTVWFAQGHGHRWLSGAGLGAGLALITKPEMASAALAAAGVALWLGCLANRRILWREMLTLAFPVFAITVTAYGFILWRVPWRVLVKDNHILFSNMPPQLIYFNQYLSGLLEWPISLGRILAGIFLFTVCMAIIVCFGALLSRRDTPGWRSLALRAFGIMVISLVSLICLSIVNPVYGKVTILAAAPLVLLTLATVLSWRIWQSWRSDKAISQRDGLLLIITIFSCFSLSRVFLNVTASSPYTPFFLPTVLVIYGYLLMRVLPALFANYGQVSANTRRVAMALLSILVIGMVINTSYRFRSRNAYAIHTPRGSLITEAPLGQPFAAAVQFVQQRSRPGDEVLTLPQATSINFLAGRKQPFFTEIVLPGLFVDDREATLIRNLEARRVPLILVINLLTPEFRDRAFGQDYNQNLMRWITQNYRLTARFDNDKSRGACFGDKHFFITAYERIP